MSNSAVANPERGIAMVELAILTPLLVMLMFGVFELGRALYQEQVITKAANAGVRYMTRAYGVLDDNCIPLADWSAATDRARALTVFAGKDEPLIKTLGTDDVSIAVARRDLPAPASAVCVIRVQVVFPFAGLFGENLLPFSRLTVPILNAAAEAVYIGD